VPLVYGDVCELTIRDWRFFWQPPDEHDETDLREMLLSPPLSQTPVMAEKQAHSERSDYRERQAKNFRICAANTEGTRENAERRHRPRLLPARMR